MCVYSNLQPMKSISSLSHFYNKDRRESSLENTTACLHEYMDKKLINILPDVACHVEINKAIFYPWHESKEIV